MVGTTEVPCDASQVNSPMPRADGRWLVVGALGMLGTEVMAVLADRDVAGVDRPEVDITDPASAQHCVEGYDVVVNCAAWTAVDDAETQEAQAFTVNAVGAANLASAAVRSGAWLIQISTDYVFDGAAASPYGEDAPLAPKSAYGRTKAAGEWAVAAQLPNNFYIIRTAWLYGVNGPNFISTMARLERERDQLSVVNDQRGQPTWARDLARQIVATVDAGAPAGRYHATAGGETTWYDLARRVFELSGADPDRITPATTDQFPRPAPRPAYSVLGHERWEQVGMSPMRGWDEALADAWTTGLTSAP